MDQVMIRQAGPPDTAALSGLYQEFHEFHVRGRPDRLVRPVAFPAGAGYPDLRDALDGIFRDDQAVIFVSTIGENLLGMAEVYIRRDEPHPLRMSYTYAYLQSLYVRGEYRRKGIGRSLMVAAQKWATENGAFEMRVEVWEFGDGPALFYEHLGYKSLRRTLTFEL